MKILHKGDYAKKRAAEYPPVQEQLEAISDFFSTLKGQALPPSVTALINKVANVKAKFPKPAGG